MKNRERKFLKALATDIDGTLTDENYLLSISAIKALRKLDRGGIPVMLASGNALPVVQTLKRYLGCKGAIICENGAVIKYRKTLKTLGDPRQVRRGLKELKDKFGNKAEEHWSNRYRLVDIVLKRTLEKSKIEETLSKVEGVKIVDSGFAYHISSKDVNKGKGLKVASRLMNIDLQNIAAIGDSETDLDLLRSAGFRITLPNAPIPLREIAHYTTTRSNGKGLTEAAKLLLSKISSF
ncbi:MAG: phosphoglycolate phosphatase [Thermoproteota archaeon]